MSASPLATLAAPGTTHEAHAYVLSVFSWYLFLLMLFCGTKRSDSSAPKIFLSVNMSGFVAEMHPSSVIRVSDSYALQLARLPQEKKTMTLVSVVTCYLR